MKVETWSDVICPWCGIGQHRLEQALARFAHREHVEVVHRSFQLDPRAPQDPRPVREMLAQKMRMSDAQLDATFRRIESLAKSEGLSPYVVGDNLAGNTGLAHELLAMASERGLEDEAWRRLYRAYFGEQRSIFDVDALVELGEEIGLAPSEVRAALGDGRFRSRVDLDGRAARALGASGVPFVVIDRRYAIAGAQSAEVFEEVLEQVWSETHKPALVSTQGATCGPEGCAAPNQGAIDGQ